MKTHLDKIVATMLTLRRCENGTAPVQMRPICLPALVRECWRESAPVAQAKQLQFDDRLAPDLAVECDEDKLGIILHHLVENAVTHGEPDTLVECCASATPGGAELRLVNTTKELEQASLPRVFQSFWGVNGAHGHGGLGLSIARGLCEMLGIRFSVNLREGRRFEARLVFPTPAPSKVFPAALSKS